MLKKLIFYDLLLLFCFSVIIHQSFIAASPVLAQTGISITNISDNRASYSGSSIPTYEKFEITFQINNTQAVNFFTPYDSNLPPGVRPADRGITVNARFLPPGTSDWNQARIQPAFYYQNFDYQTKSNQDWLYPTTSYSWKVRYAPNSSGTWQFRLEATDAGGSTQSAAQTFNVTNSSNPGFVRVSTSDPRYFEYDNGQYFPGFGYNMNYNQIDWINPVRNNQNNFSLMGQNGVQLIRMWLSQWSIFGAGWNPWKSFTNHSGDPPLELLSSNTSEFPDNGREISLIVGTAHPCVFHGSGAAPIPVKRNTNYQVRVQYLATNMSGSGGFVVKQGGWVGCAQATAITNQVNQNTSNWTWLEGNTFNSGSSDFINHLYLHLNNMSTGRVRVAEVQLWELDVNNNRIINVLQKPVMDHHRYIDQRNSYAFDLVTNLAKQNNVYLRPVVGDHRDWIFTHTDHSGNPTDDFSGSGFYFYGPSDTSISKTRWLTRAWWRYLQARWGYATHIQSWEYVNEGDPNYSGHRISADMMGKYFNSFNPRQLGASSVWSGTTSSWNLSTNTGVNFGDVHRYIARDSSPNLYFDAAEATINASNTWGASSAAVAGRWPVIRGETGFVNSSSDTNSLTLELTRDTAGVWLHNFLWAGLNHNALIESYWYAHNHIYCLSNNTAMCAGGAFDNRKHFKTVYDFLANIPLNKGGYQDAGVSGFDTNLVRVVGQKNTSQNKAHLWVQNKKHIWCAVVGNISGCPQTWDNSRLTGTITVTGFSPNTTLPVEYWNFDNSVNLTKTQSTITTNSQGSINLNLGALPSNVVDTAIKIGNYNITTSPTGANSPTPTLKPGDANGDGRVDGLDYVIWLNNYGRTSATGSSQGDFNSDGRVDGLDYVIWLNNYGT